MKNIKILYVSNIKTPWESSATTLEEAMKSISDIDGIYKKTISEIRALYRKMQASFNAEEKKELKNELNALKEQLPAFCFQGIFKGNCTANDLVQASGFVHFDIDHLDTELQVIFNKLRALPETVFCFLSPTGGGIKGCMRVDTSFITDDASYKIAWLTMVKLLKQHGIEADPGCSDISRKCFFSLDPNLYYNPNAKIMEINFTIPQSTQPTHKPIELPTGAKYQLLLKDLQSALRSIPPQDYEIWVNIGMALKADLTEEDGYELWCEWSRCPEYPALSPLEMREKWKGFNPSKTSYKTIFAMATDFYRWINPAQTTFNKMPAQAPLNEYNQRQKEAAAQRKAEKAAEGMARLEEHNQRQKEEAAQQKAEKAAEAAQRKAEKAERAELVRQMKIESSGIEAENIPCFDFDKNGNLRPTYNNVELILRGYSSLKFDFKYNEVSKTKEYNGEEFTDGDGINIFSLLCSTYHLDFKKAYVLDAADKLFLENKYNPLIDRIQALPPWDGIKRAEQVFVEYLKAEDSEYIKEATRVWMLGAIRRLMEPGCKFDTAIVLWGEEGIGKSTILLNLSYGYHRDLAVAEPRVVHERCEGSWIREFTEMTVHRKQDAEDIKLLISLKEAKFRLAYGRESATYKQWCVYAGTSNTPDFLSSGNDRRFLPIECGLPRYQFFDQEKLLNNLDQIWAEVLMWYKKKDSPVLKTEMLPEALVKQNESNVIYNHEWKGILEQWIEDNPSIEALCHLGIWQTILAPHLLIAREMQYKDKQIVLQVMKNRTDWTPCRLSFPEWGQQRGWKKTSARLELRALEPKPTEF